MKRLMIALLAIVLLSGCSLVGGKFKGHFEGFGFVIHVDTEVGQVDIDRFGQAEEAE